MSLFCLPRCFLITRYSVFEFPFPVGAVSISEVDMKALEEGQWITGDIMNTYIPYVDVFCVSSPPPYSTIYFQVLATAEPLPTGYIRHSLFVNIFSYIACMWKATSHRGKVFEFSLHYVP